MQEKILTNFRVVKGIKEGSRVVADLHLVNPGLTPSPPPQEQVLVDNIALRNEAEEITAGLRLAIKLQGDGYKLQLTPKG